MHWYRPIRLARLKTRAWIETHDRTLRPRPGARLARLKTRAWIETKRPRVIGHRLGVSPGLKPGRGLKLHGNAALSAVERGLARLKTRAWIETLCSPGVLPKCLRLARLKTRAWIETVSNETKMTTEDMVSPGLKPGRGLKQREQSASRRAIGPSRPA